MDLLHEDAAASSRAGSWRGLSVWVRGWFCGTLFVTTAVCLLWSHWKLFWVDELLELYTDTKPTLGAVLFGQLHAPFSLEPPAFHVLLHAMHRIIPSAELAARLPSIVALLLTEVCVFFVSLRWRESEPQAVAAMLLPLVLVTADYGPEARVYEVLTACLALALWCWQVAASSLRRMWALIGLAGALGCAMLAHYYGILVAVPLLVGEATRTMQRRRVDRGMLSALVLGSGMLLFDLPFERALAPFRLHYYTTGETSWLKIPVTYSWFVLHWWIYAKGAALLPISMLLVVALLGVVMVRAFADVVRQRKTAPVWVEAALLTAALLPVLGLVLAQVSHAYVPRYSLPAVVGLSVLLPATVFEWVRSRRMQAVWCACLSLVGLVYGGHQTLKARREGARKLAELHELPPEVPSGQPIYVQNLARYLVARTYAPATTRARLVAFYSQACELHWSGRDPSSLFARNIAATTSVPAVPFSALTEDDSPRLVLVFHDPDEEWISRELKHEMAEVRRLGPALGGELLSVRFRASPAASGCETGAPRNGPGTAAEQDLER